MTIKIKIGTLDVLAARDVEIPQSYAAYSETVRVEPGTYDVYAYLDWTCDGGGMYRIHEIAAQCMGITISAWYGRTNDSHIGKRRGCFISLATYGMCDRPERADQTLTLLEGVLTRKEWDPRDNDPNSTPGRMWRYEWAGRKFNVTEPAKYGGGTSVAELELV